MKEVNKEFDAKMQKTIDVVMSDFASVRAGRANAEMCIRDRCLGVPLTIALTRFTLGFQGRLERR